MYVPSLKSRMKQRSNDDDESTVLNQVVVNSVSDQGCWRLHDHPHVWSLFRPHGDPSPVPTQPGQEQTQELLSVPF